MYLHVLINSKTIEHNYFWFMEILSRHVCSTCGSSSEGGHKSGQISGFEGEGCLNLADRKPNVVHCDFPN